jgi:trimeric autotransporter adhesin
LFGAAIPAVAATPPTLVVVIVGSGGVTSQPAGIACPGKCTATFAAATSVVLTPVPKNGSTFLRWGGSCTGADTCKVNVSSLTAVAAQFLAGAKTPPPTANSVAVPGPYSGSNGQGWGITFYVAPGGRSLENISLPTTSESCTPSGTTDTSVGALQAAIQPNGSFSTKTSESGVLNGSSVKIIDTFTGRFQPATATASASAAGTWSEKIAYASGTTASCTSNTQSWTARLYREPAWQKSAIEPGDYSGSNGQGWAIKFSVAPGGKSILNVSLPTTAESCTPSGNTNQSVTIQSVAVQPNGAFSAKTSQTGVVNSTSAKITYTFAGYFEGPTPTGAATVAGTWRADIVFASGTTKMCTSNNQSWEATLT